MLINQKIYDTNSNITQQYEMYALTIVSNTCVLTDVPSFLVRDLIQTLTLETEDGSALFFFYKKY